MVPSFADDCALFSEVSCIANQECLNDSMHKVFLLVLKLANEFIYKEMCSNDTNKKNISTCVSLLSYELSSFRNSHFI